jgi:hypothetical protein
VGTTQTSLTAIHGTLTTVSYDGQGQGWKGNSIELTTMVLYSNVFYIIAEN